MSRRNRMPFPRPIAEVFSESVKKSAIAERLREAEIWKIWPEVVGPVVAGRARPLRITGGTLTVSVSSGPWMQQLRFLATMIREKLNHGLGEELVREIVFRSGRVDQPEDEPSDEKPLKRRITPKQKMFIEQQSASITDRETREAFMALMKASFETRKN